MMNNPKMRIAVFGDSIAHGLGARGQTFGLVLSRALEAELVDLTDPALQVRDSLSRSGQAIGCDVVLIAHGATEACIRPTDAALRFVPRRWRKPGGLDPRTYFSSQLRRRLSQRLVSAVMWRLKLLLMRLFGTTQWRSPTDYAHELTQLAQVLRPSRVFILSTLSIDERYFPGSEAEFEKYSEIGRRVATATGSTFVDISESCHRWSDYCADHFHPTLDGHQKIADLLLAALSDPARA